ncbi:DUF5686 family protein [Larkinella sp. VNQ87]|uniref:DUF5686 and carboxypeptidase-like regulatory domain-containing protein n=1 Tax=Larkinella sp. VNQ87 TaxID=3400921 RepID=UPI003BFAA164
MLQPSKKWGLLILGLLLLISSISTAQTTLVKGVVTDAKTGETLPFVSVVVPGTTVGTATDADGKYNLTVPANKNRIKFTYVGYVSVEKPVTPATTQVINIKLAVDATLLKEVTVKGKAHYRNRDNPAVQLIRQVIANKEKNQMGNYAYVEYEQYEKISLALSNLSDRFRNRRIFRNYQFLFTESDSASGKNRLPAYLEEKLSQVFYRRSPEARQQQVKAQRRAEFDPRFVDNKGLSKYFNRLYEDINIYNNNISIATNQLLSPIANSSPTFYKFFIRDTVKTQTPWLIELGFVPRNKTDLLFEGKLFITLDGNYGVQNAYLTVNKDINLNYLQDLEARLEFEKSPDGRYHPSKTTLAMEFSLGSNTPGIYGQRVVNYSKYLVDKEVSDDVYTLSLEPVSSPVDAQQNDAYWDTIRPVPLDKSEVRIYRNIDTLQTIPSFRRTMSYATMLIAGFKPVGPLEIGPVNTFYSFNPIEGFRLRFGGRTTTDFSKRMYLETYAAYGFKDEKWKYFLSGTYSINNQSVYAFPLHYVRASFQRDTKIPGQDLQFVQEDNFLLSFKRGENNRWLYNDIYRLEYIRELENHFSYKIGFNQWTQTPAGILQYIPVSQGENFRNTEQLTNTELNLELRYAPQEQFYQGKLYRVPIVNKYPIFTLRYGTGLRILGGENRYHAISGNVEKRFYMSQFGYFDATVEGGYIYGKNIPFPLLTIHRANQTYAYQLNSYNLMNFLEFVSDHYASINVQYYMNGFLFNKLPLLKHLKLREVFSFKALAGGLRDENHPDKATGVYRFPVDNQGNSISYTLGKQPYIEGSVGIANIFKLLRVDLVKRFTYLNQPNVSEWGIRGRFKFDF